MRRVFTAVAIAASLTLLTTPASAGTWDDDEEVCQQHAPTLFGGMLHVLNIGH